MYLVIFTLHNFGFAFSSLFAGKLGRSSAPWIQAKEISDSSRAAIADLEQASPTALNGKGGTLLLAMTPEQQRMLIRFGHITCIDATYKVVQWGLPFSMLVVVDEHQQAFPVAYFMTEHETQEAITEVLLLIRELVPPWSPKVMIMDKDDAEINACKSVFPDVTIILCEFHAKQAWLRWLRASAHGVPKEMQTRIYTFMCGIMKSPSAPVAESRVSLFLFLLTL